eukprot:TRINITY_DN2110_c0_g1_i1.p1 TRINITY_DN2110_c0_g1~~TRINITY_DN2110_c0_g1_i1.p1  ORF type:complete len:451 (+),score=64.12 TRINITY_DN2110_c0_g1_i1:45-1355(+)
MYWWIIALVVPILLGVLFHFFSIPPKDTKYYKHLQSPQILVYVNGLGRLWKRIGGSFSFALPSKEKILRSAQSDVGLYDFGDKCWEEPFDIILRKHFHDPSLSLLGVFYTRLYIHRYLKNRLVIVDQFKKNPTLHDVVLPRPIFITGLPRTGTTLLFNLMAQDPLRRSPQLWEIFWPHLEEEVARKASKRDVDLIHWVRPNLETIHHVEENNPEECLLIFTKIYMDLLLVSSKSMEEYSEWWWSTDVRPFYRFHKEFLQYLASRFSQKSSWTLKAPFHLAFLDTVLLEYPDACIIQTHRELTSVMGSTSSLNTNYNLFFEEQVDMERTNDVTIKYWSKAMNRSMEFRDSLPKEKESKIFCDVMYDELTEDPIGVIEKIYERFGFEFTEEFREKMKQWLENNPSGKHGRHSYSLEDFCMSEQQINRAFAEYKQRYRV